MARLVCFALALAALPATAAAPVVLDVPVQWSAAADVPARVRDACHIDEALLRALELHAPGATVGGAGARHLALRIEDVHAPAGGVWSGPKWIEISGALREPGQPERSFRARRASLGGPFAPFLGTCDILARCARGLARDVALWLDDPRPDALLGDAQSGS